MKSFIQNSIGIFIICNSLWGCTTTKILPDTQAKAQTSFRTTRPMIPQNNALSINQSALNTTKQHRSKDIYIAKLSPGDKIEVTIPEGDEFSGIYTIEMDGTLRIPYLKPIVATGQSTLQLAKIIRDVLVLNGLFKNEFVQVAVNPVQWAPTTIVIRGSVYNPGNILINQRNHQQNFNPVTSRTGDFAHKRLLSNALKAAGGLKPDADLRNIQLIRNGKTSTLDMSGLVNGGFVIDPPLASGDQVIVPSVGYLQTELLRPTVVTPPGFRVYLSNLTIPADSNNKAANNKYASSLPLGSRLLKGSWSANCVGGTASVNAKRHIILVGADPLTGQTRVLKRSLQELLAQPNNDAVNPYLMPEDSIACFDSGMTNARDFARAIGDFLRPFAILSGGAL